VDAVFLHKQEIDILLLQEVTNTYFNMTRGFNAYRNVRINTRGTAMLTGETIKLTNVTRLTSGYGMAEHCLGVWIVNIYAPSGSSNTQEREMFYNMELICCLHCPPIMIILGEEVNCVLTNSDCTGNMNFSKAFIRCVGKCPSQSRIFTLHFSWSGTTWSNIRYIKP